MQGLAAHVHLATRRSPTHLLPEACSDWLSWLWVSEHTFTVVVGEQLSRVEKGLETQNARELVLARGLEPRVRFPRLYVLLCLKAPVPLEAQNGDTMPRARGQTQAYLPERRKSQSEVRISPFFVAESRSGISLAK